ncbi:hypothetical protein GPECTOR_25g327 [Gonium pectorale]|uniref:holo-[acyl-carrier-protein] synthase n=1 Tax=Gonium pectorale TaxID=33097 RepID=A0A150GG26_GONPE|nr:hypothetical protein GPECTOR_25g327 [Gonium pectorale]|eukprot:KXZ48743.1 hypothetical protein GPECTOR_25g327 [Gonium pectorale]
MASTCSPERAGRYRGCLSRGEAAEVAGSASQLVAAQRGAARALARCVLARAVSSSSPSLSSPSSISSRAASGSSSGAAQNAGCGEGGGGGSAGGAAAVRPQDLEFIRNRHGKPHLVCAHPGWPLLRHNLTHTHDLAAAASVSVGLDVERLDRAPRDPMALARRRLAPDEVAQLEALSGEERARRFMWLWTLKEAYVKARGTGISAWPGLKGFSIGFEDVAPARHQELAAAVGSSWRMSSGLRRITLTHTVAAPPVVAATSPTTGVIAPETSGGHQGGGGGDGSHPVHTSIGALDADADVRLGATFSFLLFQPTPIHIGALCIAVQPASQQSREGGTIASAVSLPTPLGAAVGAVAPVAGRGGEGRPEGGEGWQLGGTLLCPSRVEHWWSVPLEGEGRMGARELTLLGVSL